MHRNILRTDMKKNRQIKFWLPLSDKVTPAFILRMESDIIIDSQASLNSNIFNSHFRALPIVMYLSHSCIVQHAKTVNSPEPSSDFEPKIAPMENICQKK